LEVAVDGGDLSVRCGRLGGLHLQGSFSTGHELCWCSCKYVQQRNRASRYSCMTACCVQRVQGSGLRPCEVVPHVEQPQDRSTEMLHVILLSHVRVLPLWWWCCCYCCCCCRHVSPPGWRQHTTTGSQGPHYSGWQHQKGCCLAPLWPLWPHTHCHQAHLGCGPAV
jgi:hypothetical protein